MCGLGYPSRAMSRSELTERGKAFFGGTHAIVLTARSYDEDAGLPLVELYVEDDEFYHFKTSFSSWWLPGLIEILTDATQSIDPILLEKVYHKMEYRGWTYSEVPLNPPTSRFVAKHHGVTINAHTESALKRMIDARVEDTRASKPERGVF